MGNFNYRYHFKLKNGNEKDFTVSINEENLKIINNPNIEKPDWAKFENFRCPHCSMDTELNKYCPVALSLNTLVQEFNNTPSYELAEVTVYSKYRKYSKDSTVQEGLSSLMGLLMVASGCPVLGKLNPMIVHHLPFASLPETDYRVFSTYLLAQYIKMKKGGTPDWGMKGLQNIYENLNILNQYVAGKIKSLEVLDANVNAVVILSNFAASVTMSLDEEDLWLIEPFFNEFLSDT